MIHEYFSEAHIELNKEVRNHPELVHRLQHMESADAVDRIVAVATYCNVALDGAYTKSDMEQLCNILFFKLKKKREILLTSNRVIQ